MRALILILAQQTTEFKYQRLIFEPSLTNNGSSQVLSMKLKVSDTQFLEYRYEMTDDYMVNFAVRSQGLSTVINSSNTINLDWSLKGYRHEKVCGLKIRCTLIFTISQTMT